MTQKIFQRETIVGDRDCHCAAAGQCGHCAAVGRGGDRHCSAAFLCAGPASLGEPPNSLRPSAAAPEAPVDEALLLLMYSPRSYTREDVVEFHCHGGIMAVQQVLQLCLQQGARLAQPGEFTLRAFLNGRLDLTQAEGVADLVGAQSPQAAQTALMGIRGKLAKAIRQLRSQCLDVLAEVEARVDFADDLPPLDEMA